MSLFHYRALDAHGQTVTGTLPASDAGMLERELRVAGMWLLEANATAAGVARAGGTDARRVRRGELIGFFLQMSLLLKAGVTLPTALERLAADGAETKLGPVLAALHHQVVIGVPLHTAMEQFPNVFPPHVSAIVAAGEASGALPDIFVRLTQYFEWADQLASDVRQALIYPAMVGSAALGFVLLLFTFVVPRFVGLLADLQLDVPLLTRVVMAISAALLENGLVLLGLAVALPIALKFALRVPRFACAWDRLLMELPVVGPLVAMLALSRFAQNLALLHRAGLTLLRGLEISRELVGNRAIARAVDEVRRSVEEGTPLHRAMAAHSVFPATLVTMVATGESSGSLAVALQGMADYYNKLVPRRIKVIFGVFDPAIMIALIGIVGFVGAAVILPILQLWQAR
jgi:type II secretory pathway component PulF